MIPVVMSKMLVKIDLFNNCHTQQMLSPEYRVSYISSIGQNVSVKLLTIIRSIRANAES